jgi:hypothetical protein
MLNSGTNVLTVVFTPADALDYSSATNAVSLFVAPAPLTVTVDNASRPYGAANPAFTGAIAGLTNGDNITALYNCAATTNSTVQTYAITPTLSDPGNRATNYAVSLVNGTLTVTQAVPLIIWTNPVAIEFGTPLSSRQLNATANVPGSLGYTPSSGTVLNRGANSLSVIFTPTDTVDYTSATSTVSLVVNPIPTYLLRVDASAIQTAGVRLTMSAVPGQVYEVQASSDLLEWADVTNATGDASGMIQVLDAAATNYSQRFYRAVTQAQ